MLLAAALQELPGLGQAFVLIDKPTRYAAGVHSSPASASHVGAMR